MGCCTSTHSYHTFDPEPPKTTLFKNRPTESIIYRIPALIYIEDTQTFLAFAEKRTSPADVDATFLVMRRGTRQNGSIQWEDIKELTSACLDGYRTMSPCPVYDKDSKTVFLVFTCVKQKVTEQEQICCRKNRAKLCYVTSEDSGKTWSRITDLTEHVIGDEIKNWATFSVGPGHGIQMKNGRLVIPAYVYYIGFFCVTPHSFAFYSDDHGKNWQFGKRLRVKSTECEMAEITSNGKSYIYCNTRNPKCCRSSDCSRSTRVEAWSENGGTDFDTILYSEKLVESRQYKGCQGSVVSFTHGEKEMCLLYSHPTDSCKRNNLGIYLNKSPLNTSGWNEPHIINPGLSGYSDLAHCGDDLFACLLERGTSELEEITFVEFSLSDVIKKYSCNW